MSYRLCVAGSRNFNNVQLAEEVLSQVFNFIAKKHGDAITIISGGAKGADSVGELVAHKHHYDIERYLPDWDRYGKSAGYKRNQSMCAASNGCVVFWDGSSRGSHHMIDICRKAGKPIMVVDMNGSVMDVSKIPFLS